MGQKKLTGYPSIDKPWLKYYSEEAINAPLPEGSLYEYMTHCNIGREQEIALNYFGKQITHHQLQKNIDRCSKALISCGVKKGDYVSLCLLTIPEAAYLLYAVNKIGAVCNFLVLNASEHDLHEQIAACKSKLVVAMDMVMPKIVAASKETDVKHIVSLSVAESMPLPMSVLLRIKSKNTELSKNVCLWKTFLRNGTSSSIPDVKVKADDPAIIEYTGGTTGSPKGVLISNRASNSFSLNHSSADTVLFFKQGQRYLDILPPFYAYGIFSGMHMPLCIGMENILAPDPSPKLFPKLLIKYRPNHFSCGPLHIDNMMGYPKLQKANLSFIQTAAFGGDKVSREWEEKATNFLTSHGSPYGLSNGYGMTETCGAFCLTMHKVRKMIPYAKNNIKTIDIDTGKELKYGEAGEICVSGPTLMLGYYKHPKETADVIVEENGIRWMHTGDLGYITEDGALIISGRIKRILYSVGADQVPYRIYPMQIESVLSKHPSVKKCSVVGRKDGERGYLPIAFVVLDSSESQKDILDQLKVLCKELLPENAIPYEFRFVESLPLTPVGKVDYRTLEKLAEKKSET